ncbi:hypothetical protein [Spiroplasma alleghenense]|uniref:Lipoprotein n=1 Tax=Spiroplasma alleghenense TaxID=216931 RepID=A0A345Z4J2_9MOLU|nr:hypothetical protein [Spiroplasma alleghenense]AXK51521.1 hypothetical protein SALLE_v1c08510 [Spiroplasma alleghenense]
MKKLLSIFAASAMVVSTPLSVVACKKTENKVEFDFDVLTNQLISEVTEIVNQNLNQDFNRYQFIENDIALNDFNSINIKKILQILSEKKVDILELSPNSSEFVAIGKDLTNIVKLEKLTTQINQAILQNINYKPILINGQSPFKNDFELNQIKLTKKTNDTVSILATFNFNLMLKDRPGNLVIEKVTYKHTMNIFQDAEIAKGFTELSNNIGELLESEKYSNSMEFMSNSGNYMRTTNDMNNDILLKAKITEAANEAKIPIKDSKLYSIDLQNLNLRTSELYTIFGESQPKSTNNLMYWENIQDDGKYGGLLSAITSTGYDVIDSYALRMNQYEKISQTNNTFMDQVNPYIVSEKVQKLLLKDEESSWALNHYNIDYFLNDLNLYPYFSERISKSKFKLSETEDRKTIAIWGTEIENISVTYEEYQSGTKTTVDMPNYFFINRQKTHLINTKEYVYRVNFAWLEVCRQFLGFENINGNTNLTYNLKLPQDMLSDLKVGVSYNSSEILNAALEKAISDILTSNPRLRDFVSSFRVSPSDNGFIKINSEGFIHSYNEYGYATPFEEIEFWLQGTGVNYKRVGNGAVRRIPRRKEILTSNLETPTYWRIDSFNK